MNYFRQKYSKEIQVYSQGPVESEILKVGVSLLKGSTNNVDNLKLVKGAKGRQVFSLDIDGERYYLKRYYYRQLKKRIKNIFRAPEGVRAYDMSIKLLESGISVANPIGVIIYKKDLITKDSLFITKEFAGEDLQEYIANGSYTQELKEDIIRGLAKLWATIYKNKFINGDPNLPGILVKFTEGKFKLSLVDMDNIRQLPYLPWKLVVKNLVDFNAHSYSGLDKMNNQRLSCADRRLFFKEFIKEYGLNVNSSNTITYISKKTSDRLIKWGKRDLVAQNDDLRLFL